MSAARIATGIGLSAVIAYMAAHAVTGDHGVFGVMALKEREQALTIDLASLESQRAVLADEAQRLNARSLDLDLVEERARQLLNAAHPDEIVLSTADLPALQSSNAPARP
jgi:cell division protein FtsB